MKSENATDSLCKVVGIIIRAASDTGAAMIHDLATMIVNDGKIPANWE